MSPSAQRASASISVEIEKPGGTTYLLDPNDMRSENRPQQLGFRTQRGDGFADGSFRLRRSALRDYPDLEIGDEVRFIGGEGQILYEGYAAGLPREIGSDGSWVTVPLAGWMSSAKDRRFREIYIDRDLSRWTNSPSSARKDALLAGALKFIYDAGSADVSTDASGIPAITLEFTRLVKAGVVLPFAETWYSPGIPIGQIVADYSDRNGTAGTALAGADWTVTMMLSDDDIATNSDVSSDLSATSGTASVAAGGVRRHAALQALYAGADTASDGKWRARFANLYALGNHGLSVVDGGLTASSMIADIAKRFCPHLDTSGVQATTYPIRQAAFLDPAYPYDAWIELNKAHLWELSVFEGRKLHYEPPSDLDDYDWQVRTDDPGVSFSFAGDSLADFGNGVEVSFTDLVSGERKVITPDDYSDLRDTRPDNAMNRTGRSKWLPYDIPFPCFEADAVQYGRAYFAEAVRPKSPVSINAGYYVRNRAGNKRPASEIRNGDRIAITDHPNSAPRRIIDTSYNHDGRGLTISADRASQHLSALIDRITLARQASGLT